MIAKLRSWAFNIVFFSGSVVIVLIAPLAALLGTQPLRSWVRVWVKFHRWCARWLVGVRIAVSGTIPREPALYAAKHQAMFETLELVDMLDAPVIVMKEELARIPVWGWAAKRYGMIVVDRAGSSATMRTMLREAKAALADGRSVVIFPEGTRVAPGEAPPVKPGFAGLYRALGLPMVTVAIDSGIVWPRHATPRAGTIRFHFGEVTPPGLPRPQVEAIAHQGINALEPAAG